MPKRGAPRKDQGRMEKRPITFRPDQMGPIEEIAEYECEGVLARAVRLLVDEALAARAG